MKYKKTLIFSFLIFSLIFGLFTVRPAKAAIVDKAYNLENDLFYENNTVNNDFIFTNNVRNITSFTGHYNATYTFTNDINGNNPLEFIIDDGGGFVIVVNSIDAHEKITILNDTDNSNDVRIAQFFNTQTIGIIELWIYYSDVINTQSVLIRSEGSTKINIRINNNKIQYFYSAVWNDATNGGIIINTWYHYRLEFSTISDTFEFFLNGISLDSNIPFENLAINLNNIQFRTGNTPINYHYIDGIGYSWDTSYNINDNIVPFQETNTEYLEVDKYKFTLESLGNKYSSGYDNPSGWIDVESGTDNVNVATNPFTDPNNLVVDIFSTNNPNNINSLLKDDFNLNSEKLNITFGFSYEGLSGTATRGVFQVKSLSDDLVIWIEIRATGDLRWFTSDPPGTFETLKSGFFSIDTYYEFNIYIDYSIDIAVLMIYESGIHIDTFYNELVNNEKTGLSSIEVISQWLDGNIITNLDYVGIYNNGSSIAKDLGYVVLDLQKDIEYLNPTHNNLATVNLTGNFNLIYSGNRGITFGYYLISASYYDITSEYVIMNESERLFNFYDSTTQQFDPLVIAYLNNGSSGFRFNRIKFEGVKMTEGINTYWLEFSHSGVNINENYFYVNSSNKLQFSLNTDDTNLEYIQAEFNIQDVSSLDYAISFKSYIDNKAFGYFRVNFTDISIFIPIPIYDTTTRVYLPQDKTIDSFIILITDENLDYVLGLTEGYVSDIELLFVSGIGVSITTSNLLTVIIPLIIIFIPTLLLSNRLSKNMIVPIMMLMSLLCVATEIIPIWLFFVIVFPSSLFLFLKRKELI